ncbi:hypothetical protein [Flammeovirga pacifica]|uniref:Uncharacterized protein n=1 Tax=Flammeovirga pacifica TaxID=915059 RepID=A0A1S1Z4I3_FLAPC|nr:hypothetical protein [Flammeovirga pacifica]OHX67985.1 hypothetical protein NH26_17360 [Flammeovirga pacifica]
MKKIILLLSFLSFLIACNDKNDISLGENFDKVIESETADTLIIYHSGGLFEAYIVSSNSYLKSRWHLSEETDKIVPIVETGLIWKDCSRIYTGFNNFPALLVEELNPSDRDIFRCDF